MNFLINIGICKAEIKKQIKNYQFSLANFFSLLIWPTLSFFEIYFQYKSFDIESLSKYAIYSLKDFYLFLITGTLVFNCFWSMVQSAFMLTFERQNGTLESTFATPANKLVVLYGRSLGGMFTNLWMFVSFSFIAILIFKTISIDMGLLIVASFFILLISSTIWGGFVNSLFLISRDSSYLFTIFDEPMKLFSGTSIPVKAFPHVGQLVAALFPATYCLKIIRLIFLNASISLGELLPLIIILIVLVVATYIILFYAEKNNKQNGSFQLF